MQATGLPTGTVTFLFTDVEGSTKLLHGLGAEGYGHALAEHRRLVRKAFARHAGVEVDTQGDAFFYVFSDAQEALAAAQEANEALAAGPIRIRIGIHTGKPHLTDEGYVGADVHLGARVAAAGHGGQVLLSAATRACLDGEATDLGEHRLKGFAAPVQVFQLGSDRFPPLKTISNTNLPRPASSFVGREREVEEVRELLQGGARLVTLSGPGGSGKTRLAIETASDLVGEFKAGVFWVPLATIRDPALVPDTIAQTLGAKEGLAEHIQERELLLLLDNLEQVIEAALELASLVEACPNLKLLVTSRELLRIRGEVEYPVLPLAESEAVELFCERARLEPEETVAELCRRLDSLPLAVELAAARARLLTPPQILDRLSHRLDLLRGGRDADARQQTLRATIEWSYDLLRNEEKQLLARLAVFAGGSSLEAAEAVAGADLDTLQSLVDKSLLRHTEDRFWMLETIREFAAEHLQKSAQGDDARRRHAEFFVSLAESTGLDGEGDTRQRFDLALAEQDNVRAALSWLLPSDPVLGLRLVTAVEMFWVTQNPLEGTRWLRQLLQCADGVPPALRAKALRALGGATTMVPGQVERGTKIYEQSLAAYQALGDDRGVAILQIRLGEAALERGEFGEARRLFEDSLRRHRKVRILKGQAQALSGLSRVEYETGNGERAMRLARESVEAFEEGGFPWLLAGGCRDLAYYSLGAGDFESAKVYARRALELSRELGDRQSIVYALMLLAASAGASGDAERAGRLWGGIEVEVAQRPVAFWETDRARYEPKVLTRAESELQRGLEEGRLLTLEDVAKYALSAD